MNWEILGLIVTTVCGFVGVILSNNSKTAVLENKIDTLTDAVRKLDNVNERLGVLESKIKNLENEVFNK